MRYYIFYVDGNSAFDYLNGTNLVGVWEDSYDLALEKCKKHFKPNTSIWLATESEKKQIKVGYLY